MTYSDNQIGSCKVEDRSGECNHFDFDGFFRALERSGITVHTPKPSNPKTELETQPTILKALISHL